MIGVDVGILTPDQQAHFVFMQQLILIGRVFHLEQNHRWTNGWVTTNRAFGHRWCNREPPLVLQLGWADYLTIKQDGLAWAWWLTASLVVIALEHDILGISEVGNIRVGSILNPGGILQRFTRIQSMAPLKRVG